MRSRSFARRLTWWIILVLFLSMAGVALLLSFFGLGIMIVHMRDRYFDVIDVTSERVEKMLSAVEISAVNNVDEVQLSLGHSSQVFDALDKELKLNPHLVGCAVAFVPDFFPDRGRWFEPYVMRTGNGTLRRMDIGSPSHDYHKSPWFVKGMQTDSAFWSEPYVDDAGAKAVLCSYIVPVHDDDGSIVGLFCADVSLDWLSAQVQKYDLMTNERTLDVFDSDDDELPTYSFIVGRRGEYIVHPERQRILRDSLVRHLDMTPGSGADSLLHGLQYQHEGYVRTTIDGLSSYVFYKPLEHSGWSMGIVVPWQTMFSPGIVFAICVVALMLLCLFIIFPLCYFTIRRATRPLHLLAKSADEVARGRFDSPLPIIRHHDEIRHLRDSFSDMQRSLARYVQQLQTSTARQASIESELTIARAIQMAMLPKDYPPFPDRKDIDIFGQLTPAKAVGGDLYDFFIRDERLFFCIGDVSGKGVPASLIMAVTSAQFRTLSASEDSPERILVTLNDAVTPRNESNMFVTLFVGVLDLRTGRLDYSNAGHDAPLLIAADGTLRHLSCDANLPVGVMMSWAYTLQHDNLAPNDILFLFTDGLTEAEDTSHAQFGVSRLHESIGQRPVSPETLVSEITAAVHRFVGTAEQSDDLTMLAIQYTKGNERN